MCSGWEAAGEVVVMTLTSSIVLTGIRSFSSHLSPMNPAIQLQINWFIPSLQVPLFSQGLEEHSSMSSQWSPLYATSQLHV